MRFRLVLKQILKLIEVKRVMEGLGTRSCHDILQRLFDELTAATELMQLAVGIFMDR